MFSLWNRLSRTWLTTLGLLALPVVASAVTVTGFVKTTANVAVGNVDIDLIDNCTGTNIFIATDKTAADGSFSMSVPAGNYDIHFVPPFATTTLAAADSQEVQISANTNLGTIRLASTRLVSGTVKTPTNAALANVDLKFINMTDGQRRFLTKTVTDASGNWSVRVPAGTWQIDFRPAVGSPYADGFRTNLVVGSTVDVTGLVDNVKTGFTVSGTLRGKAKIVPANADISLFNECTGLTVPTSHDNSDALGAFSVVVPAGTYTLTIAPPNCLAMEAYRQTGLVVSAATALGQITLQNAVPVTGRVLGPNGLPLARAKLKFYDVTGATAVRVGVGTDRTDTLGRFTCYVIPSTYDINVDPPVGVNAQQYHVNNLVVGAAGAVTGDLPMITGTMLSANVTGNGGHGVAYVNMNVIERTTRVSQRLSHDYSDSLGNIVVYINPGTYDIHYDPPVCSGLAPWQQDSVVVSATKVLPTMNLVTGIHMTGLVRDTAFVGVSGVDLDVFPAGAANKLFTPTGTTTATGTFDMLLPPGSYDINFIPNTASRCRAAQLKNQAAGPLAALTLPTGRFISGSVFQADNFLPVVDATLDFIPVGTLAPLYVAHHTTSPGSLTAAVGSFKCVVNPGTYDVHITPPLLSQPIYSDRWIRNLSVVGDVVLGPLGIVPFSALGVDGGMVGPLRLSAPSPNPSRGPVSFSFSASESETELSAWDVAGRKVATIWRGRSPQPVTVSWNGRGSDGQALPPGLYLVRLNDHRGQSVLRHVTLLH